MSSELSFRGRESLYTRPPKKQKKRCSLCHMEWFAICHILTDGWGGHFCILKLVSRKSCQHINKKPLWPYNLVDFTLKNCGGRS